jgi:outer membrane protein assembly factor BamA
MIAATPGRQFLLLLLTAMLGAARPPVAAQLSTSAHKLVDIKVTGKTRFATADIVTASGLQMGLTVGDEDFKKAARNLGETGAFSDVGYKFSYSSAGTKLELQLTDTAKWLPVRFDDFVWFSDAEMQKSLKEHVPLFTGELPTSGRLAEEVSDALQALLVRNGIAGHVDYVRTADPNGEHEAFEFSVANVLIQVNELQFPGAGVNETPLLKAAIEKMADRSYSRRKLTTFAEKQLLPIYHARGYLKASFGPPEPKVVKVAAADANEDTRNLTLVDVTYTVTPGLQYKLSRLEWSGNHVFPTETLQTLVHAPVGEPLDTVRLSDQLVGVQTLYGSKGYITATVKANADYDDAASTVAITLAVTENPVYHMGDLEFRGLDNSLTAKLRAVWKLQPGDVYDSTYLKQYLPDAQKLLPAALDWDVSSHVTANLRDHSVDVDLIFSAKAPR